MQQTEGKLTRSKHVSWQSVKIQWSLVLALVGLAPAVQPCKSAFPEEKWSPAFPVSPNC
jgi:hypothetical protein